MAFDSSKIIVGNSFQLLLEGAMRNQALQRVINPAWFPNPDSWVWAAEPHGPRTQGFGRVWRDSVGMANLQWLLLDRQEPPDVYNVRTHNPDYVYVMAQSQRGLRALCELAELHSLQDFCSELRLDPLAIRSEFYKKLITLAEGRLNAKP